MAAIVQDAIDSATNGLAQQIGQSLQIREYAAQRDTRVPVASRPRSSVEPSTAGHVTSLPTLVEATEKPPQVASSTTGRPAQLSFRAIIRDENGDQFLQPDESLTIQIEVKNEGMGEAKDVMVIVEGKTDLAALFPSEVHLGMLQSGEIKRTSMTQRVTASQEALQGDLTLNLRTTSPVTSFRHPKSLVLGSNPEASTRLWFRILTTCRILWRRFISRRPSSFRSASGRFETNRCRRSYARHDAEVMAEYLRIIGGVPGERIRILLDRQAIERDLEDTFERWFESGRTKRPLCIYFCRASTVDGGTGAISLVPYDGTLSEAKPQLYPLARLQESLIDCESGGRF